MKNAIIVGTGKIGIDLYIKCLKSKIFDNIYIFNRNKFSEGAKFCRKKKFQYSSDGIKGVKKLVHKADIIFDATSSKSNDMIMKEIGKFLKKKYFINLTPSKAGEYIVPYINEKKIPFISNLITCGGQTSIPIIKEIHQVLKKKLKYVELVSSISSKSAGAATRENINEYIVSTESAIKQLTRVKDTKVIININPSDPPINMMNSLFFELNKPLNKRNFSQINTRIKHINKIIKSYIPNYNAKMFPQLEKKILRVTIRVVGQGDYLPSYAGNLDIITSAALHLARTIYEKKKINN